MNGTRLVVDDASLEGYFDERTLWRGMDYVERGKVGEMVWDPGARRLFGEVNGSGRARYETAVQFDRRRGVLEISDTECTCPVGYECKHAVALVLSVCMPASVAAPESRREPEWETAVRALLPEPVETDTAGLGIQITVALPQPTRRFVLEDPGALVTIRPVVEGRTGWVAGKLTWSNLQYSSGPDGQRLDRRQLEALQEIYALSQGISRHGYYGGADKTILLGRFDSPLLWTLLESAQTAGVRWVQGRRAVVSPLAGTGRYCVELAETVQGEISVTPMIRIEGVAEPVSPIAFVGQHGHGVVFADPADVANADRPDKCRVRLARLDPPAPATAQTLLSNPGAVAIPAADRDAFLGGYYPRLRRAAVVSSSESFSVPAIHGPELLLDVRYGQQRIEARWWWSYQVGDDAHRDVLGVNDDAFYRDRVAEQTLLAELDIPFEQLDLGQLAPQVMGRGIAELDGVEALRFATELLPLLDGHPRVGIAAEGTAPDYRDTGDSLVVAVSPDTDSSDTDWFDLGITITAEGRDVPLTDVFLALCADRSHVIMPDGAYFSLQKPALQALRRLIEESRELYDAPPGMLRLSRFHADFWAELLELGVVARETAAWQKQLRALADLNDIEPAAVPADVHAQLRHYQQDGFSWLAFLWRHGLGGVLADDMGLGKTLQALALICHARQQDSASQPWLIIAPASVVANWAAESARFVPGLRTRAVSETLGRSGCTIDDVAGDADIVVTSYALLRLDFDAYSSRDWSGLILDEAQFVKNHQSKGYQCARRIRAPFKLAVTGTPIENNLMEMWALMSITAPGLFPHPGKFREYYAQPIEKAGDSERLAQLRRRIRPLLLRRTKELVAADLPAKQEQVLEIELAPKHRKLYHTRLQRERQKVLGLIDDIDRNRFTILQSLTVLRQLSLHAGLVDEQHASLASAKIEVLIEHLHDVVAGGHRALVFSQFTGFLARVRERLEAEGIEYCYLDGKTRKRTTVIQRFRDGAAPVFLISLKAGGFGLNLTEADYCFLLDPWWNPATEAQAVDRTHRIGQTRNVMVYRLIAADTIEQKVMDLKARKSALFDGVLDDEGGGFAGRIEAADIRALFE